MLLYYITDRHQFPGDEAAKRQRLLEAISAAARAEVDYIQLREKDLTTRELEALSGEAVAAVAKVREGGSKTKLLINSRTDVAIAIGAEGVHLRADDISAGDARAVFAKCGVAKPVIGVSCHTEEEVALAESQGADFAVFGPVFEKEGSAAHAGLERLKAACARPPIAGAKMPVLALGGVTLANAAACLDAGADGIAGIRLFQSGDVAETVKALRAMRSSKGFASPAYPYGKS